MVKIKPFKGYLYNSGKTGDISGVIAPPWDIISDEEEKELLSSSEWNIIRLISQKILPSDADRSFQDWIKEDILVKDAADSFYFLRHKFSLMGKTYERKGIFALLKIEDFSKGNIIPHEHVFEKYHNNRYKLIEKCRANFSPVFMLYQDFGKKIEGIMDKSPVLCRGKMKGDSLEFGRIDSLRDKELVTDLLSPGKLLIADGHHRYQAAYRFYTDNPDARNSHVLVFLANLESSGLIILPTHRYIPYDVSFEVEKDSFEKYFHVEKTSGLDGMFKKMEENKGKHAFGIYEKGLFSVITLKDAEQPFQKTGNREHSRDWLSLDNVILKDVIINRIFRLGEKEIMYNASHEYLLSEYARRKEGVIVFVNPVSKESFLKISLNGEKMPQKSTYFYPKVPTGLVIHKF